MIGGTNGNRRSHSKTRGSSASLTRDADARAKSAASALYSITGTLGPAVENAGIRAGEIIGYRYWLLDKEIGFYVSVGKVIRRVPALTSVIYTDFLWFPNSVVCGNVDLGEGVNSFKSVEERDAYIDSAGPGGWGWMIPQETAQPTKISGSVRLWGSVVEHQKGYRAQYASVDHIDSVSGGTEDDRKRLTELLFTAFN